MRTRTPHCQSIFSRFITHKYLFMLLFFLCAYAQATLAEQMPPSSSTGSAPHHANALGKLPAYQTCPPNPAPEIEIQQEALDKKNKVDRENKKPKIIGLVQIRNEQEIIEQCLRALACYTDAIVVLDDASQDNTVPLIKALAQELHIETVIENQRSAWQHSTENANRQKLLEAGRAAGGTHFILIDADEMFSANCANNNWLRSIIVTLEPGTVFHLPCVNLWDGLEHYRDDQWCNPAQKRWVKPIAFCDDGVCSYANNISWGGPAKILHAARIPINLTHANTGKLRRVRTLNPNQFLLHFKYANLDTIAIKKNWYMCLEFIRAQEKQNNAEVHAYAIKTRYTKKEFECLVPSKDLIILKPVDPSWLDYPFIHRQALLAPPHLMVTELASWVARYGADYFAGLELENI
jgi:glycosyltransferase involved in cell wall biosynthesis